jgi:glycopeptide antibiotics resistance protein
MLSANVLVMVAGAVMIVVIVMGRARGTSWLTIVARCASISAIGWILALTIFPIPVTGRSWRFHRLFSNMSFVPFRTIGTQLSHGLERYEAKQLLGNIALFIPLGFLLPCALRSFRRAWPTLLVAAGLSVLIETTQAPLPGHSTDVDDVILNTIGAAAGYLAFLMIVSTVIHRTAPKEGTMRGPAPRSAA